MERDIYPNSNHFWGWGYEVKTVIVLQFKIPVFSLIIFQNVNSKVEFSASLLQSSVSHDLSEIILICQFAAKEIFRITILIFCNITNSFSVTFN